MDLVFCSACQELFMNRFRFLQMDLLFTLAQHSLCQQIFKPVAPALVLLLIATIIDHQSHGCLT